MRKTALDIVTIVYQVLTNSPAVTALTNKIFKFKKPLNFSGECIVLNSLPLTTDQLQSGIININWFVPNIVVPGTNPVDRSTPNTSRLEDGATVIDNTLKKYIGEDYTLKNTQTTVMEDATVNQHYVNFRIQVYNQNI